MEHIAIFTCYADMKLTSVYSGKGFVFIRTFSFFAAAAAAPAWTIVLGYCNHSFNLVYLFSRYTFVVVAQKSAAASSTSSPSRGHLSLSPSVVVNHPYFIGEKWCCCRLLCCRATFIMLGLVAVQRHITTFAIGRECHDGGMALLYWASSFVLEKYFWPNFCFFSCIFFCSYTERIPIRPSVCRYVRPSICPIVIYTHILKCWFNFSKRIMMVLFYLFIHIACEIFV